MRVRPSESLRPGRAAAAAVLLAVAAWGAAACGDRGEETSPSATRPPAVADEEATFTQIMIGYRHPGGPPGWTRSKGQALDLAEDLLARIRRGESMERLLAEFTDDRGPDGEPFNSGTVTLARRASPAMEAVKRVMFALRRGELCRKPIDTGLAYLVVRRDT